MSGQDADHSEPAVLAELREVRRLFPAAVVCGDDWQWLGVRRAVMAFAAEAGVEVASHPKENWWLLETRAPSIRGAPAEEPEPKRARVSVEFASAGGGGGGL